MSPFRYIMLLITATVLGVLGVAQRAHVIRLGYSIETLESELDAISEDNRRLLCEISALSRPERIADRVERFKIDLMDPVELSNVSARALPGRR